MKFISCLAPQDSSLAQRARTWLYVAECPVAVGDYVVASFGYSEDTYMKVTAVGTTREAVGSDYTGAVKVITRVATELEAKAFERLERAEESYARARTNLRRVVAAEREKEYHAHLVAEERKRLTERIAQARAHLAELDG